MAKKKQPDANQRNYQQMVKQAEPKPPLLRNCVWAFVTGGLVCVVGQLLTMMYARVLDMPAERASNPAVVTMVFLGALLTGFGVFDKLARVAGMGVGVPVTGFANSMTAAALEFKREGLVYGVGGKMFSLAGSVIVFGVVTAFVAGLIHAALLGAHR